MKTIIAGSRTITDIDEALNNFNDWTITEVVSGCARGVDKLGEVWATTNNIPIKRFPADWNNLGKSAGYVRNHQMADYAEALIAIWDGKSKGTKHMIDIANNKKLKVVVICQ